MKPAPQDIIARLCLKCGLCCNGALFRDVELGVRDDAEGLKRAGLRPGRKRSSDNTGSFRLPQPCRALGDDCHCAVYEDRPGHCRDFECLLFGEVAEERIRLATAQRIARRARRLFDEAQNLIDTLSDVAKAKPLRERFRRISRMLEEYDADEETLAVFGELTQVWHELNHLLGSRFYREP